jgi:ubiquinol-cytochrome c reductase cytochrome c subunit
MVHDGGVRRRSVLTICGVVVVAVTVGFTVHPPTARAATRAPVPVADAQRVYLSDCAVCHGDDGAGTANGPTLIGVGRATVDYYVSTGRMPLLDEVGRDPLTRKLTPNPDIQSPNSRITPTRHNSAYPPEMISALVDYVHNFGSGGPDIPDINPAAGDLTRGGEVFRLQCAACHAWSGDGGALYRREAPELHDATALQVAEAVRVGPGLMPAFGPAAVNDADLDSLVAYVRGLRHPNDRGGLSLWHLGPVAEGGVAILVGLAILVLCTRLIGERS